MNRIFFIGDIHGCSKTFRKLVTEEIGIRKTDLLYCVGDYIDRGNDSKGVVDFILELRKNNFKVHSLRGNHEQMLLDSGSGYYSFSLWLMNGGDKTLESFSINSIDELKPVYADFFRGTEYFIETKDFIAVHAGLNFTIDDPLSDKHSMLWIRDFEVDRSYLKDKILIHGHTPRDTGFIKSQRFESPLNVDGGCVYKNNEGMGSLFAFNFYERNFIEVKNID
jgi:serine/threonine protein phosphatase 1